MSEDAVERLREMAANRGFKLVTSRVRTPGKGDHGRFGLKGAKSGKPALGIGKNGLTATSDEITAFLRGGAQADWQGSLGSAGKRGPRRPVAKRPPPPPPPRPPGVREARPKDAEAIAALIGALGYEAGAAEIRKRLAELRKRGETALVIERDTVMGVLTTSTTVTLHRPGPVGRISMMVVAESERGKGLGARLVAAAEEVLKARGCLMAEVTSNRTRLRAHAFYEKLGYERTSYRFAKLFT